MEMLAVKRMPKKWKDIRFQDSIIKTLTGAIKKKQYPNVILLKGPSGIGKTSIAKVYTASLMCENRKEEDIDPCGICKFCESTFLGEDMGNIKYLSGRIDSGVDFYRNFIETLESGGTLFSNIKIVIIDEAHGLSPQALEVLLTPLEKPNNDNL